MLRTSLRSVAAPLARSYASQPPAKPRSDLPLFIAGAAAGIVGGVIYFGKGAEAITNKGKMDDKHSSSTEASAPEKLEQLNKEPKVALNKDEWRQFELAKVSDYNHNTKEYTFKFPDADATAGGPITHCIMVKAAEDGLILDDKGKDVARPYTPTSSIDHQGELVLLIKKYDTGKLTPHLASLKVGDSAAFKGPFPKFPYKPSELEQGVAIAGGSGITPMWQLINHSLSLKDDTTKWTLIYSNVTEDDILLRKEWESLAAANSDRLKVVYSLDKPSDSWKGLSGFITADVVKGEALPKEKGDKVKFFVCGPPGQVAAIAGKKDGAKQGAVGGALAELGYEASQVFKF